MIDLALQFRYTAHARRATCARFLPGGDTVRWLDELTSWGVPLESVRLYPLPRSRSDNRCLGVLVVSQAGDSRTDSGRPFRDSSSWHEGHLPARDDLRPAASLQRTTLPYGCVAGRLYLPVEAAIFPDLREAELAQLLGSVTTRYVWHPQSGLVAFDTDELLTVADLLSPQAPDCMPEEDTGWGLAQVGASYPNRIMTVRARLPESAAEIMAEGRGDIATRARDLRQLQSPIADQIKSTLTSVLGMVLMPLAFLSGLLARLLSAVFRSSAPAPRGAPLPAWMSSTLRSILGGLLVVVAMFIILSGGPSSIFRLLLALGLMVLFSAILTAIGVPGIPTPAPSYGGPGRSSAAPPPRPVAGGAGLFGEAFQRKINQFMRWTAGLLDARQREMERLMKLLRDDPDEGLKYALPMGGEAGRGLAAPSGWLTRHLVDFQLGGYSGGPADVWDLPPDTQLMLVTRYRELAAREIQLGRYRRAAYIFAELLGDLNSAATTLEKGRFYREAAVLYRDKLNRPLEAARCLEEGGLLLEAIPIYQQHDLHEKVGDLYQRLQDFDAAETAWRQAVSVALGKRHYQEAAALLTGKLKSPDEALDVLDAGWRESSNARSCLEAYFALLTRLGRHDAAVRKIQGLRDDRLSQSRVSDAIHVLAGTATGGPHAPSRVVAADTVRVLASRALAHGHPGRQQITAAVGRLALEDKLLTRDCKRAAEDRFADHHSKKSIGTPVARNTKTGSRIVKTFELPTGVRWLSACATDRNFYAVGQTQDEIVVSRGAWNDPHEIVSSVSWNFHHDDETVLMCHAMVDRKLYVASTGGMTFLPREFPVTDANPDRETVESAAWMPRSVSAVAATPGGAVYTFQLMELLLQGFNPTGLTVICETLLIPMLDETIDSRIGYRMAARNDAVYLAIGPYLIKSGSGKPPVTRQLSETITGLAVSPAGADRSLAVTYGVGGAWFVNGQDDGQGHRFGLGLTDPRAVILRNGNLILHGRESWMIYKAVSDRIELLSEFPSTTLQEPFELLRSGLPNQVALCTVDGRVTVHEFLR